MSEVDKKGNGSSVKVGLIPILISVTVAVLIAIAITASGAWYLARSGRLQAAAASSIAAESKKQQPEKTHAMVLDPLLVNLSDPEGQAYLKVSITLLIIDEEKKGKEEDKEYSTSATAAARDAVLGVAAAQTSNMLLAADGKEHLKQQIKQAITHQVPYLKVTDVLFTDFLVQR